MRIVGIDPGATETGLVAIEGRDLLKGCVVIREKDQELKPYILEVIACLEDGYIDDETMAGVEGVDAPLPYIDGELRLNNPMPIIETGAVFGAVIGRWPEALVIPPGKNGKGPRRNYPAALWGAREEKGTGRLRHCRSAWDVALQVRKYARLQKAAS